MMLIPAGYLYKKIMQKPDWLAVNVDDIYSISNCISVNFTDYIHYWQHNGWWLFDSPLTMQQIASQEEIDLSGMHLFYYEVYSLAYDGDTKEWFCFKPDASMVTNVEVPAEKELRGYDIASFSVGTNPECSPLSCNGLAAEMNVNKHCLFDDFENAKQALEQGFFEHAEPGPYRIFAVYKIDMCQCLSQV